MDDSPSISTRPQPPEDPPRWPTLLKYGAEAAGIVATVLYAAERFGWF